MSANVYKWGFVGLLFVAALGWGTWQRGDRLYFEGEAKRLAQINSTQAERISFLQKANKGLIDQAASLGDADNKIDVQYRDRFRTIEKVVKESDPTAANAVLSSLLNGFYTPQEAASAPDKGS